MWLPQISFSKMIQRSTLCSPSYVISRTKQAATQPTLEIFNDLKKLTNLFLKERLLYAVLYLNLHVSLFPHKYIWEVKRF